MLRVERGIRANKEDKSNKDRRRAKTKDLIVDEEEVREREREREGKVGRHALKAQSGVKSGLGEH
jgi:hypothetical protein